MEMKKIASSNITAAGHIANTLRVRFDNGVEYDYPGVSPALFEEFMAAKSQGRFYHANIKVKFTGTKVEKEDNNG